jgi:hypothetical protein
MGMRYFWKMSKELGRWDGRVFRSMGELVPLWLSVLEMSILSLRTGLRDISPGPIIVQPLDRCMWQRLSINPLVNLPAIWCAGEQRETKEYGYDLCEVRPGCVR